MVRKRTARTRRETVSTANRDGAAVSIRDAITLPDGASLQVTALITGIRHELTRNQDPWSLITLTDHDGEATAYVFPLLHPRVSDLLTPGNTITCTGRLNRRPDGFWTQPHIPVIYAQQITAPTTGLEHL